MIQFDINSRIGRLRYITYMSRQQMVFERYIRLRLRGYLKTVYVTIANEFADGIANWESVLSNTKALYSLMMNFYQRVFVFFSDLFFDSLKKYTKVKVQYKNLEDCSIKDLRAVFWEHSRNYMKTYCAERVSDITKTTKNRIQKIIKKGLEDEVGRREIAKQIRGLSGIDSKIRAARIAATETHTAMSYSIHESALVEKVMEEHEWGTARDERVRESHVEADGQRIPIDQPFIVDGEELDHPGDPKGSPGNIINCRCIELFHMIGRE